MNPRRTVRRGHLSGRRHRVRDGLVGAALLAVVLVLLVGVVFVVVSRPAAQAAPTAAPAAPYPDPAPADLEPGQTWLGDVDLGASELVVPEATLVDVVATGQGVRSGPDGLVASSLAVEATVPFAVVAAQFGAGATLTDAGGGQAELRRSVTVLGRTLDVRATGTVVAEDGLIVVEPQDIDLGGPDLLGQAAGSVVRELVTIRAPVEGVPADLVLREVTVQQDGFRARLDGEDVRLDG